MRPEVASAQILERIRFGRPPDEGEVAQVIDADGVRLGSEGAHAARRALSAEVLGLGPLEPLVAEQQVTDVLVNGDGTVWADRGTGLVKEDVTVGRGDSGVVGDERATATRRLAVRLAGLAGRRLDESQPWVDGLLPGGIRLHAILPPLADGGAHISLRVPRRTALGIDELQGLGMFDGSGASMLRALVERSVSFVITGGTGTGKTTLLGALLACVPRGERIVLVEDVRELAIAHPHVVRLQARAPNVEGRGEVTLVQLVRQALRMRPDRLVVGEVRGAEVRELLSALNTGHEGGCGTVHANRPEDVPARFEALAALAGMSREATHAQLASALRVVVHLRRAGGVRVLDSVAVLHRPPEQVVALVAVQWSGSGWLTGPGWPSLASLLDLGGLP